MSIITILNGTVVRHDRIFEADLRIEDEIITEIHEPGYGRPEGTIIDAAGLYVLPGAIDIHFHCRAPAYPERGDFATETRAAAAGGVTTVFEMPISKPGVSTVDVFEKRRELGEQDAYVDFGLYAAAASFNPVEVRGMVDAGAIGFKTFTTAAPEGRADEFRGLTATTADELLRVLELLEPYDLPAVFHAESNQLLELYQERLQTEPLRDLAAHARSRPPVVESTAIATLIALAQEVGRGVHIAHLSSAAGLAFVRDAQHRGIPVTAETCPHYLLFAFEELSDAGPFGKINPPIRSTDDRDALWEAVLDGTIDVITTDHAPFSVGEKEQGLEDISEAPPGAPSVEVLYPFVLDEALRGRITLQQAVNFVSTRPSQMYNLYPYKGIVDVGAYADLTLFDPDVTRTIDRKQWFSKAAPCDRLYTGREVRGSIVRTLLRGEVVYEDGNLVGTRGSGNFVRPLGS